MKYYSTNNKNESVTFKTALMKGLAEDKGLYMPSEIPSFQKGTLEKLWDFSFEEIAFSIASLFIEEEISPSDLEQIINSSISFKCPLVQLDKNTFVLELFHGPTLAFKDFGARFMARTLEHFMKYESKKLTILVATSGDTGSAVANGFLNVEGIDVVVLYPKNKISKIQQKQITTLGNNINALEIDGTFDDCQRMVKAAFVDSDLKGRKNLSSANSINIGRLIPQSFYYFEAAKQLEENNDHIFAVPSGNLGNLTAGLIAGKMGLPVRKFIAATNKNDVFTKYILSGEFIPRKSTVTISNAMDVGNPSNLARIKALYNSDHSLISKVIYSKNFSDKDTLTEMERIYNKNNYIIDPHGAVGSLALNEFRKSNNATGIILETAHASKFLDVFSDHLEFKPEIPQRLSSCLHKESNVTELTNNYDEFKSYLLD
jgi:threonine synthase